MAADQQTKQQAAAEALRGLLRSGGAAVRATIQHPDPDVRRAAAKRLLTGTPLGDPEAAALRKDAAQAALADYGATSLGRGWPAYDPDAAAAAIEATGVTYAGHDSTGETL
ncbi:hypothetical protein MTER_24550 [Mycolicibacter terrae]|uniref:Uncharacterized protein n=1 Tax=Mycolicibacter terrae TaxID=1788 RepID=A0AAD1HYB3_9MYCO|nr:hypothetical protein [Mycolicibacter terrae]ORW92431.1 hypothetical protein AWC28_00830 [Mycolicibacter terrae]BBX23044.1 hypothetical protein MTER_24550 [Mycolicibacter terrae]SNV68629.1 Uncharacterised protein [Mycolicibacter terrae]